MSIRIDTISDGTKVAHVEYQMRVDDVYMHHHVVVSASDEELLKQRLAMLSEDLMNAIREIEKLL